MSTAVHILSWVAWGDPEADEQSCGGFEWYLDAEVARQRFAAEPGNWGTDPVRVRLVQVEVPFDVPLPLDASNPINQAVTTWIDEQIDDLETVWPGETVTANGAPALEREEVD